MGTRDRSLSISERMRNVLHNFSPRRLLSRISSRWQNAQLPTDASRHEQEFDRDYDDFCDNLDNETEILNGTSSAEVHLQPMDDANPDNSALDAIVTANRVPQSDQARPQQNDPSTSSQAVCGSSGVNMPVSTSNASRKRASSPAPSYSSDSDSSATRPKRFNVDYKSKDKTGLTPREECEQRKKAVEEKDGITKESMHDLQQMFSSLELEAIQEKIRRADKNCEMDRKKRNLPIPTVGTRTIKNFSIEYSPVDVSSLRKIGEKIDGESLEFFKSEKIRTKIELPDYEYTGTVLKDLSDPNLLKKMDKLKTLKEVDPVKFACCECQGECKVDTCKCLQKSAYDPSSKLVTNENKTNYIFVCCSECACRGLCGSMPSFDDTPEFKVVHSRKMGFNVMTPRPYVRGEPIVAFSGELTTVEKGVEDWAYTLVNPEDKRWFFLTGNLHKSLAFLINPKARGNSSRFVCHSRMPNCEWICIYNPNMKACDAISILIASEDIESNSFLYLDYGKRFMARIEDCGCDRPLCHQPELLRQWEILTPKQKRICAMKEALGRKERVKKEKKKEEEEEEGAKKQDGDSNLRRSGRSRRANPKFALDFHTNDSSAM